MPDAAKQIPLSPPPDDEISTAELLHRLTPYGAHRLVFSYEGRDVLPGYHVTEVKDGRFEALDCGANAEAWRETFIQLWDVPGDDARVTHMPVSKFSAIMKKVGALVAFDAMAKLTFEVSDGVAPIQLYRADAIDADSDCVRVTLSRRPASCKPRDRWLAESQSCCSEPQKCCA
jgi:hypothetical protein